MANKKLGKHKAGRPGTRRADPATQTQNQDPNNRRFPDYILCGSLNLHKSPVNAAALAKYISRQWEFLRINKNGIISSKQLEINRNPTEHGGLRNGKPLTVTEWEDLQRAKLLEMTKINCMNP